MRCSNFVTLVELSRSWLGEKFEIFAVVSVTRVMGVQISLERGKWVNALLRKINLNLSNRARASS
jgi:hypothetical protein